MQEYRATRKLNKMELLQIELMEFLTSSKIASFLMKGFVTGMILGLSLLFVLIIDISLFYLLAQ